MGRKAHPIGLRLGDNRKWSSNWIVDFKNISDFLTKNYTFNKFLTDTFQNFKHYINKNFVIFDIKFYKKSNRSLYVFCYYYDDNFIFYTKNSKSEENRPVKQASTGTVSAKKGNIKQIWAKKTKLNLQKFYALYSNFPYEKKKITSVKKITLENKLKFYFFNVLRNIQKLIVKSKNSQGFILWLFNVFYRRSLFWPNFLYSLFWFSWKNNDNFLNKALIFFRLLKNKLIDNAYDISLTHLIDLTQKEMLLFQNFLGHYINSYFFIKNIDNTYVATKNNNFWFNISKNSKELSLMNSNLFFFNVRNFFLFLDSQNQTSFFKSLEFLHKKLRRYISRDISTNAIKSFIYNFYIGLYFKKGEFLSLVISNLFEKYVNLKRHGSLLNFIKTLLKTLLPKRWEIKGVKIKLKGRLNKWRRTKISYIRSREGNIPLRVHTENIIYGEVPALLKRGLLGIKIWVHYDQNFNAEFKKDFLKYIEKQKTLLLN